MSTGACRWLWALVLRCYTPLPPTLFHRNGMPISLWLRVPARCTSLSLTCPKLTTCIALAWLHFSDFSSELCRTNRYAGGVCWWLPHSWDWIREIALLVVKFIIISWVKLLRIIFHKTIYNTFKLYLKEAGSLVAFCVFNKLSQCDSPLNGNDLWL